ncbi:MAG: signal peptidase II [Polyangiaceae bacterium]|nr:signal peptidase II [Polyangiaceae bacterium]MCW5791068.1 signal peptidase II [Polyangiaceae bacterium]
MSEVLQDPQASAVSPLTASKDTSPEEDAPTPVAAPDLSQRPSFRFFGVVASVSLVLDVASKAWAALALEGSHEPIVVLKDHLSFTWALNRGGAWGILQDAGELVRRPFFFAVSVLAVVFIVSLYGRLHRDQWALKWGLPLVLGGALGNLADRIVRGSVIDFIDYRADWVGSLNGFIQRYAESWTVTDHWPTFNVADISICVGVALMAVDMIASRKHPHAAVAAAAPAESSAQLTASEPTVSEPAELGAPETVSEPAGLEQAASQRAPAPGAEAGDATAAPQPPQKTALDLEEAPGDPGEAADAEARASGAVSTDVEASTSSAAEPANDAPKG